jgi:hypothetical protein
MSYISVIHPTRERPEMAIRVREAFLSRAKRPGNVEYIFGFSEDDEGSKKLIDFDHVITPKRDDGLPTTVQNSNAAFSKSVGKVIVFGADDIDPPEGWDAEIIEDIPDPDQPVVLAVGDGCRGDGLLTHPVFTRVVPGLLGLNENEMFSGEYDHLYVDREFTHRANKLGIIKRTKLTFNHMHPFFGKGQMDNVYVLGNNNESYIRGENIFRRRNPDAI